MEKAKKFISDYQETSTNEPKDIYYLKPEINNLLHQFLPSDISIGQADALACCIYDIIQNPKNYLGHKL